MKNFLHDLHMRYKIWQILRYNRKHPDLVVFDLSNYIVVFDLGGYIKSLNKRGGSDE